VARATPDRQRSCWASNPVLARTKGQCHQTAPHDLEGRYGVEPSTRPSLRGVEPQFLACGQSASEARTPSRAAGQNRTDVVPLTRRMHNHYATTASEPPLGVEPRISCLRNRCLIQFGYRGSFARRSRRRANFLAVFVIRRVPFLPGHRHPMATPGCLDDKLMWPPSAERDASPARSPRAPPRCAPGSR
jgi:hypothetical protein